MVILDGWGFSKQRVGNAIQQAQTPTMDLINRTYPSTLLQASGLAVGLGYGELGNSEVGHLNIGAGRIVQQYLSQIDNAIKDHTLERNQQLLSFLTQLQQSGGTLHLAGLLTSGTVHAAFRHIVALLDILKDKHIPVMLHLFLDGKDSGLQEGSELLRKIEHEMQSRSCGTITSIVGRHFAMDRDNNWDRTQKAYDLIATGQGIRTARIIDTLQQYYQQGFNDENMEPIVLDTYSGMHPGDGLFFFNFREDAIRQLAHAFVDQQFMKFSRHDRPDVHVAAMTEYFEDPRLVSLFPLPVIQHGLAETISNSGKRQFHITETEKYAHVTYFFNGLHTEPFPGETDVLVESHKDHRAHPEMRTQAIADRVIAELQSGTWDFIVVNFPNADIIAHYGDFAVTVQSIEATDSALSRVLPVVQSTHAAMIICADHGNAEGLVYRSTGEAETKHNDSPVPCYLVADEYLAGGPYQGVEHTEVNGVLADIAPTVLELMNIAQPDEMTGHSLLSLFKK